MGCPTPGPLPAMGITLTRKERRELERTVRRATAAQRDVQRAKIALLVAEGWGNAAIARALGCAENTVRRWRRRFAERRREGLEDRPRSGRPRTYDDRARTVVKGIACELPATRGLPLSRLSLADLHGEVRRELRPCPSRSTIGRWLREDAIKPWQHRMWVTPRAPDFYVKASRVLDLYHARGRGKRMRGEHESSRHGVLAYQAVLNVRTGKVRGQCVRKNTKKAFRRLVDRRMKRRDCRAARRVFWILDNGGAHDPRTFPAWLAEHHPNAVAVYLPVHGSWLNEVEIYFGIVQRKALTTSDFRDREALRAGCGASSGGTTGRR